MKTLRNFTRNHRILAVTLLLFTLGLGLYAAAQYYVSATAEQRATDRYYYLLENHRIADLEGLIDTFAEQQFTFMDIALPGTEPWDQSAGVYPVDWANFPEEMTKQLVGYWEGEVPVYELYVYQDEQTREIVVLNADGKEIYSLQCTYGDYCDPATYALERRPDLYSGKYSKEEISEWIAHYDLARVGLRLTLVPTENLYPYLYAQAQEESFLQAMSAASLSAGGGGMAIMMGSGGSNEMEVVGVQLTSGVVQVTVAWPTDWTNRIDIYSFDGGGYNGAGFGLWELADSGLVTLGTNELHWLDTGQLGRGLAPADETRFYAAGNADLDPDGDGYNSGYEKLVLNAADNVADTDGDGISDGPFDPDGNGSIVFGPDPFPLDSNKVADVDGDGIEDTEDPDDDNDGLLDGEDPDPLVPGVIAPFKVVSVVDTNPPGSDTGDEVFDISSAGGMLPYAQGGDALNGFGRIHGGIYFNHDGTNLYVGVAGYSKQESFHGDDALLILLDTTTGGVSSLSAINSGPRGLSRADNLNFQAGTFEPDVGILVGSRYEDGRNNSTAQIGGKEYGQGVYWLSGTTAADLSPVFTSTGPSPISQWGDTPFSTNLANAGIEVALPLSNILESAWTSTSTTFVQAAAIVLGGDNGTYQFLSTEAYGKSVSGSFGNGNTTLLGEKVYLSPNPAPEPSATALFDDSQVMLQGFGWNVPRPLLTFFDSMTVAGTFNGWDAGLNNMTAIGDDTWEYIHIFTNATGVQFKFTADGSWGNGFDWGEDNQTDFTIPITNEFAEYQGGNITLSGTLNGSVRFRFNNASQLYSVEAVTNGTVTTLLAGFSELYWYERLKQEAESNQYARFDRVWMNPPQKGKSGRASVGYDVFDPHDLGTYDQKGAVVTRYGTEAQLKACYQAFAGRGIECIVDMVLNHMNNSDATYRYDYEYSAHRTFEKRNGTATETNNYFNVNYTNYPFGFDFGFGLPEGVNAWDAYPTAHSADVNERHPYMRNGIKNNGSWLQAQTAARGCRFDFTQGMSPGFFAEYARYGLMKDRFHVGEYWAEPKDASAREHQTWIALMDNRVCSFDFPLHEKLLQMCNFPSTFDMEDLSHGALIHVNPERAVTFVESHDEIRPFGDGGKEGMKQKKELAYAFVIMSEGHPCVFRQDYSDAPYADTGEPDDSVDDGWKGDPLKPFLDPLIDARKKYAGGTTTYLSTANKDRLYIAKRNGTAEKDGCIIVINNHLTQTLTNTVDTGWSQDTVLVDALDTNHTVTVQSGGVAPLSASNRFYRVYVRQEAL